MLKTIVIDDEIAIVESTSKFLKTLPYISLACASTHAADCLNYMKVQKVDVAILDIDMPDISGLEIAKILGEQSPHTKIIFVTSHDNYIKEAFNVYAYDFIEKPVDYKRLSHTLKRAYNALQSEGQHLTFTTKDLELYIAVSDIYMIEAQGKHACIYTKDDIYCVREPLKEIESMICSKLIFKAGRSYLINLEHVSGVEKYSRTSLSVCFKEVTFKGQLSKTLYDEFKVLIQTL